MNADYATVLQLFMIFPVTPLILIMLWVFLDSLASCLEKKYGSREDPAAVPPGAVKDARRRLTVSSVILAVLVVIDLVILAVQRELFFYEPETAWYIPVLFIPVLPMLLIWSLIRFLQAELRREKRKARIAGFMLLSALLLIGLWIAGIFLTGAYRY